MMSKVAVNVWLFSSAAPNDSSIFFIPIRSQVGSNQDKKMEDRIRCCLMNVIIYHILYRIFQLCLEK